MLFFGVDVAAADAVFDALAVAVDDGGVVVLRSAVMSASRASRGSESRLSPTRADAASCGSLVICRSSVPGGRTAPGA